MPKKVRLMRVITKALTSALQSVPKERDGLWHCNEGVFRYLFIRSLGSGLKSPDRENLHCQVEWHLVDLLLKLHGQYALVELKFHASDQCGAVEAPFYKKASGPGGKNWREFRACVRKLARIGKKRWMKSKGLGNAGRYLILGYVQHDAMRGKKKSYQHWYTRQRLAKLSNLRALKQYKRIPLSPEEWLHCHLFEVRPNR
jgi:hypothetical protein